MSWTIRIVALATGEQTGAEGQYVAEFAHTPDGRGDLALTHDRAEAQTFATARTAFEFWQQQAPPPMHLRHDGRPNRPLTAWTVKIEEVR